VIWRPKHAMRVELHYRKSMRCNGLHLATGTVVIVSHGPGPINAEIRLDDGRAVIVPRGNMVRTTQIRPACTSAG